MHSHVGFVRNAQTTQHVAWISSRVLNVRLDCGQQLGKGLVNSSIVHRRHTFTICPLWVDSGPDSRRR